MFANRIGDGCSRVLSWSFLGTLVLAFSCPANAFADPPAVVAPGVITSYNTGWSADQVRVQTSATFVANGCPTTDGYITNPSDPGNHTHQAALLAAFMGGKPVQLWIQGCFIGRPQIVGVALQP
jgi:hypothetical protein